MRSVLFALLIFGLLHATFALPLVPRDDTHADQKDSSNAKGLLDVNILSNGYGGAGCGGLLDINILSSTYCGGAYAPAFYRPIRQYYGYPVSPAVSASIYGGVGYGYGAYGNVLFKDNHKEQKSATQSAQ